MVAPSAPGAIVLSSLTGQELVNAVTAGPQIAVASTALIAGLSGRTSTSEVATALNTVGNGVITAAGIVGGVTTRGGTQTAARTDTTATAALIIAALPAGAPVGTSWEWTYRNSTIFPMTISGGTGVTVSGATVVPAGAFVRYLVTAATASTVTMAAIGQGFLSNVTTFVANGATPVTVAATTVSAGSSIIFTLKTVGGTVGAYPAIQTITPQTGFTVACTALDTSTYNVLILG